MYKRVLFTSLLLTSAAWAQEAVISGKDFLSGAGDAKIAEIAKQAAAEGKTVQITAPKYWHDKVTAKVHAGAASARVQASDSFQENVVVKIVAAGKAEAKPAATEAPAAEAPAEDKAAAEKAAAAKKAATAKAAADKAAAEKAAAEQAAAEQAAAEKAAAEKAAAEKAAAEKAAAEKAAADKIAAEKAAAAKAAVDKAAAEKAAADALAAKRQNMEKNLNEGRPAAGTLQVTQLVKDDVVYIDGSIRGVVRRVGPRPQLYWLEGDLNLERIELLPNGASRYNVVADIHDTANPTLRTHTAGHIVANLPAPDSAERKSLQTQYAEGRDVTESLHPADLRSGDVVYTGQGAALVVRRAGTGLLRFWLEGDLNLGQSGLQKQGGGTAYKVLSDTIK
jgi:hypothetical protein